MLWSINVKDPLIVSLVVFIKDLYELRIYFIAVHFAGLNCHVDSAVRHKGPLQRLVSLKADYFLKLLSFIADIGSPISRKACNLFCLKIKDSGSLFSVKTD